MGAPAVYGALLCISLCHAYVDNHRHHHRRSISYDDRWFGFRWEVEPRSTTVSGDNSSLHCSYSLARERSTVIEWRKGLSPITTNDKRLSIAVNGSLLFKDPGVADEGVYQCVVHVSDSEGSTWTFLSRKARVRVAAPLRWISEPSSVKLPLGKPAALSCQLEEADGASIQWMKNGQPISSHGTVTIMPVSRTLELSSVRAEDAGEYWCEANRPSSSSISSRRASIVVDIGVEWPSELHWVVSPKAVTVSEGDDAVLECLPSGEGNVGARWLRDGIDLPFDDHVVKVGAWSIHLVAVTGEMGGLYSCKASDGADSLEALTRVLVLVPPHITTRPQDIVATENTDVELECFTSGRPSPSVSWFKNGESLIPSKYFVIDSNKLKILGLVKTDQGIYDCFASNDGGNAHSSAQLLVDSADASSIASSSGQPVLSSAPLSLHLLSVGSRDASIAWEAPLNSKGTIHSYHLHYREETSERERVLNFTGLQGRMSQLQPSTTYVVQVAAENEAGLGERTPPLRVVTTQEHEVPGRVLALSAVAISSDTIEVHWRKPERGGPQPIRYRLFYSRKDAPFEKETQISVASTAYTMHGMDKFTWYSIRVEAEGESGPGLSSESVSVRTLAETPSSPPSDISLSPISTTEVKVTWKADESLASGLLRGIRMRYKAKTTGAKPVTLVIDEPAREYTVDGLEPATPYQFRLALINENGTGPYSDWLAVETLLREREELLLGAPRELRAIAGSDHISLHWRPPPDEAVNVVRGFQIGWGQNVPDVESSRVGGDVHEYRIVGLKPGRDYVVSVRAFNRVGSGFPIYETVRTNRGEAHEGIPPPMEGSSSRVEAPMGVAADSPSPTSIRLTWPLNPQTFNAVYTIRYSSRSDAETVRFINTSDSSLVIEKLKPGTEYEMAVRTVVSGGASAWSMAVSHSTLPAPPSSAPRDLTILPAASGDPQAVTVNWQPPKYANGQLKEYILLFTDRGDAREMEWNKVIIPADRLSYPIDTLIPKTTYYFRMQAKNVRGEGPMSPVQVYSPRADGFIHPPSNPVKPRPASNQLADMVSTILGSTLYTGVGVAMAILLLCLILLCCVCCFTRAKSPPSAAYGNGRKSSSGLGGNELWIQHGVAGPSAHLLSEAPSLAEIKGHGKRSMDSPTRYMGGTMHRGEDTYAAVVPRPPRVSLSSYEESSLGDGRPLVVPRPPPRVNEGSLVDSQGSGTLSRSYQHSTTSLDHRQRTPQLAYSARGPMSKMDMVESPYGSSLVLGMSGTPPPPNVAPPLPPLVSADSFPHGMRSFAGKVSTSSIGRVGNGRAIPVGRAAAQPRVNVANLCNSYVSGSTISMEEEKARQREREREDERSDGTAHLHPTLSIQELHNEVGDNIDHMINDLQALQQQFSTPT